MRHAKTLLLVLASLAVSGCVQDFQQFKTGLSSLISSDDDDATGSTRRGRRATMARTQDTEQSAASAYAGGPRAVPDGPYTLDSGDKLRVVVYGQEGLSNSYTVDAGGSLSMPLIGSVPARGLTPQQLGREIAASLRRGYIREPHVAVEIETYRPFFILGEVAFPGQYPYVANMTVETAIAIAGGFSPRAKREAVDLSRPHGGQMVKGSVPMYTPVRPGDTITVAERWF
jgi:polysaccharide export outer membrane protein